jgi:hypothetical protein
MDWLEAKSCKSFTKSNESDEESFQLFVGMTLFEALKKRQRVKALSRGSLKRSFDQMSG